MKTWRNATARLSQLMGWLCLAAPGLAAAATLQAGSAVTQPGQNFSIGLILSRTDAEAVASFQCDLVFDPARFTLTAALASALLGSAGKQLQASQISTGRWRILAFGLNQNLIPAGELATVRFTTAAGAPEGENLFSVENLILSDANGQRIAAQGLNGSITVGPPVFHSADTNHNLLIDLNELLRGIQLFNAGQYYCDPSSEDGFAVTPGPHDCIPHDSDYKDGSDWRISLTELLRLIQFFNVGGYVPSTTTEDGFAPSGAKHE